MTRQPATPATLSTLAYPSTLSTLSICEGVFIQRALGGGARKQTREHWERAFVVQAVRVLAAPPPSGRKVIAVSSLHVYFSSSYVSTKTRSVSLLTGGLVSSYLFLAIWRTVRRSQDYDAFPSSVRGSAVGFITHFPSCLVRKKRWCYSFQPLANARLSSSPQIFVTLAYSSEIKNYNVLSP